MKSYRQMIADKDIRRADAMKARLEDLHEEPGFNLRLEGEDLDRSVSELAEFMADGGKVPDIEVRPRQEGGLWVVDGHRRRRALVLLDSQGRLPRDPKDGEAWIGVTAFVGNDAERAARVITSQEGRKLSPLERAEGYRRLAAFGWSPEQIARKIGKTRQHVDQMLLLINANADVHAMVQAGEVAAATAVEIVREHGEDAGAVLRAELEKAKASGKKRVTDGTMRSARVPRGMLDAIYSAAERVSSQLSMEDHGRLQAARNGNAERAGAISVPLDAFIELQDLLAEAQDKLEQTQAKERERMERAKQEDMPLET